MPTIRKQATIVSAMNIISMYSKACVGIPCERANSRSNATYIIGCKKSEKNKISSIAQLEPVFAGFRTIQANKSIHRSTLTELTHEGQLIREELDSLIAIPRKSHQDSIHIVQSYNRLESIVKSLQNNDHP